MPLFKELLYCLLVGLVGKLLGTCCNPSIWPKLLLLVSVCAEGTGGLERCCCHLYFLSQITYIKKKTNHKKSKALQHTYFM